MKFFYDSLPTRSHTKPVSLAVMLCTTVYGNVFSNPEITCGVSMGFHEKISLHQNFARWRSQTTWPSTRMQRIPFSVLCTVPGRPETSVNVVEISVIQKDGLTS